MRLIAGPLNRQLLQNLLAEVIEPCTRVRAAVAYANRDNLQLFDACAKHLKPLEFFGRYDHTVAVDPAEVVSGQGQPKLRLQVGTRHPACEGHLVGGRGCLCRIGKPV